MWKIHLVRLQNLIVKNLEMNYKKFFKYIFILQIITISSTAYSFDNQINKVMKYFAANKEISIQDSLEGKKYNSHIALKYYTANRCFALYKSMFIKADIKKNKELAIKYMDLSGPPHNVMSKIISDKKGFPNPKKSDDPNLKKVVSEILVDSQIWEKHYNQLIKLKDNAFTYSGNTKNDEKFCTNIKFQ